MFTIIEIKVPEGKAKIVVVFLSIIITICSIIIFYVYVFRATIPPEELPPPVEVDEEIIK